MEQSSKILKNGIRKRPIPNQGLSDYNNGATERRFSPYSDNGGSVVAIAGEDFCVIASDTRLSQFAKLICLKLQNVFVSDCKMYLCQIAKRTVDDVGSAVEPEGGAHCPWIGLSQSH